MSEDSNDNHEEIMIKLEPITELSGASSPEHSEDTSWSNIDYTQRRTNEDKVAQQSGCDPYGKTKQELDMDHEHRGSDKDTSKTRPDDEAVQESGCYEFCEVNIKQEPPDPDDVDESMEFDRNEDSRLKYEIEINIEIMPVRSDIESEYPDSTTHHNIVDPIEVPNESSSGQAVAQSSFLCDICHNTFTNKYNMIRHMRRHSGENPFTCRLCKKSFSREISLKSHIRIHTGEKPFRCEICLMCFPEKVRLNRHMRLHTGENPHECTICKKKFSRKESLKKHLRIHTGEKPHKCNECQKSFNNKHDLKIHVRIHTGEKPYKCKECQKTFRYTCDLTSHIRKHTGEKPFDCNFCEKSFSKKSDLNKHLRIHTGEKPFTCDKCNKSFSEKSNLNKHKHIHTRAKPIDLSIKNDDKHT